MSYHATEVSELYFKSVFVHLFVADSEHIPSLQCLPESPEDFTDLEETGLCPPATNVEGVAVFVG